MLFQSNKIQSNFISVLKLFVPGVYRRNNFNDVDDGRNETCSHFDADLAGNDLDFLQKQKISLKILLPAAKLFDIIRR